MTYDNPSNAENAADFCTRDTVSYTSYVALSPSPPPMILGKSIFVKYSEKSSSTSLVTAAGEKVCNQSKMTIEILKSIVFKPPAG